MKEDLNCKAAFMELKEGAEDVRSLVRRLVEQAGGIGGEKKMDLVRKSLSKVFGRECKDVEMYFDVVADLYSAWVSSEEALEGANEQLDLSLSESDEEISFKPTNLTSPPPIDLPAPPKNSNMHEAHPALHRFWDFVVYSKVRMGEKRVYIKSSEQYPATACPLTQLLIVDIGGGEGEERCDGSRFAPHYQDSHELGFVEKYKCRNQDWSR